jgi:hypothetical protein
MIEQWFGEITNKRIRRESWESVAQLKRAIKEYIKDWNIQEYRKPAEELLCKMYRTEH